jgi:hypothetical protein
MIQTPLSARLARSGRPILQRVRDAPKWDHRVHTNESSSEVETSECLRNMFWKYRHRDQSEPDDYRTGSAHDLNLSCRIKDQQCRTDWGCVACVFYRSCNLELD